MLKIGTSDGRFHEYDPVQDRPATKPTQKWLKAIQDEIISVLKLANIEPDENDNTQLLQAVKKYFSNGTPSLKFSIQNAQHEPTSIGLNLDVKGITSCVFHGVAEITSENKVHFQNIFEFKCSKKDIGWTSEVYPFGGLKENTYVKLQVSAQGEVLYTCTQFENPFKGILYLSYTNIERFHS